MRIAFLCTSSLDYPSPRGRWLPVAQELAKQGYQPHLLMLHHTYDRLSPCHRHTTHDGVVCSYVGQMHVYGAVGQRSYYPPLALIRVSLMGVMALARAAIVSRPDAIHVCKPQPINGLAGVIAARVLGCPLYVDCDDYEAGGNRFNGGWQHRIVAWWEDNLPRLAAGTTVNTRFLQQRYQQLGVPSERIAHIPNGIAESWLRSPSERQVAGLRSGLGVRDGPLLGYIGTLSETTHSVGLLLEGFAEPKNIAAHSPAPRLLLVGDGEDRTMLQERARFLGIAERCLFIGAVQATAIPAYLALLDGTVDAVFDTPVAAARSPLKIVESLAMGVPVVTGDVGDRAELLGTGNENTQGGIVVAPGDPHALAMGIEALLQDQERLRAGAREQARRWRWENLVKHWEAVYRQ
jgi:glycosyltransferase involved in cell wall biosynthesis